MQKGRNILWTQYQGSPEVSQIILGRDSKGDQNQVDLGRLAGSTHKT